MEIYRVTIYKEEIPSFMKEGKYRLFIGFEIYGGSSLDCSVIKRGDESFEIEIQNSRLYNQDDINDIHKILSDVNFEDIQQLAREYYDIGLEEVKIVDMSFPRGSNGSV